MSSKTYRIMHGILYLLVLGLFASEGLAETDQSSKRASIMPHVPQNVGFADIDYGDLKEGDCRHCHGSSLADRHHQAEKALNKQCSDCHEVVPPNSQVGLMTKKENYIVASALKTGKKDNYGVTIERNCLQCHKTSWHHQTDYARTGKCVVCHDSNLITNIGVESPITHPISKITPTPASCSNCHGATEKPPQGMAVVIKSPEDNHHDTGLETCTFCHFTEDDIGIRGCENCHGKHVLHGIPDHVANNDMCFGCHGSALFLTAAKQMKPPVVTTLDKKDYLVDEYIAISGSGFGDYLNRSITYVSLTKQDETKPIPVVSWSNSSIVARLSYEITEEAGTFILEVKTVTGKSKAVQLTVRNRPAIDEVNPHRIEIGGEIIITGSDFGSSSAENQVMLTSIGNQYLAKVILWKDSEIKARIPAGIPAGQILVSVKNTVSEAVVRRSLTVASSQGIELKSVLPANATEGQIARLVGYNFGTVQTDGSVVIGKKKAKILKWNNSLIVIRIPAELPQGKNTVTVRIPGASSNSRSLTIKQSE